MKKRKYIKQSKSRRKIQNRRGFTIIRKIEEGKYTGMKKMRDFDLPPEVL